MINPGIWSLTGCQHNEETKAVAVPGEVTPNHAYVSNFGDPPQGKEGRAFARIGYLPTKNSPGMVRPIPLFLFSAEQQLQQILQHLIDKASLLSSSSDLHNPFPPGVIINSLSLENGVQTIEMSCDIPWPQADITSAGRALAQTALQFSEIETVKVVLNGENPKNKTTRETIVLHRDPFFRLELLERREYQ